jgi:rubredoxin
MVHRWQCRHCDFVVWSADGAATVESAKSHLLDHYGGRLTKDGFQVGWDCPYCDAEKELLGGDESEAIRTFKDHLFDHVEPFFESGVHIADGIDGTGSVLVRAPLEGTAADNARRHFCAPGDVVVLVTTTPAKRLRLLRRGNSSWPAWTVVITTVDDPLDGVEGVDTSSVPLEIVKLDEVHGLQEVGQTISTVVGEQDTSNGKLSVEFDILAEIIAKFDLETVFRFLHILNSRLEQADALTHYYLDPDAGQAATSNILESSFDMTISAEGEVFVG